MIEPTKAAGTVPDVMRAILSAGGALVIVIAASAAGLLGTVGPTRGQDTVVVVPPDQRTVKVSFSPVVKKAAPAVVNVYARTRPKGDGRLPVDDPVLRRFLDDDLLGVPRERARSSLGSGVIVSTDGLIVTNHHVVDGADDIKVALRDRREFVARIVLSDKRSDLAVLRIDAPGVDLPTIPFADSEGIEVGDLTLAIGDPFGVGQTVTSGIVSAVARTEVGINDLSFFIQTDAAINPGNSGGALVDVAGNLIGINTAIYSRGGGSNGIGFAIPSNIVRVTVEQAAKGAERLVRPWVGVVLQDMGADIAAGLGLDRPQGVIVASVVKDSPAEKAGLAGGDVILSVDGAEVGNMRTFDYRITVIGPGRTATVRAMRDGKEAEFAVALIEAPESVLADQRLLDNDSPLAGATVANLSPKLAETLGLDANIGGVVVTAVEARSPAAFLGLVPGDIVRAVQGRGIGSSEDLAEATEGGRQRFWRLGIERGGRVSNIVIRG